MAENRGRDDRRRLLAAFAIAVALHEAAALLVPTRPEPSPPERVIVERVSVTRFTPSPKPTPTPEPTPPPSPIAPRAPVTTPSVPIVPAAPLHLNAATELHSPAPSPPTPNVAHTATGTEAVANTGQGSSGARAGEDSGSGSEPCGAVYFTDLRGSRYDDKTGEFMVDVRISVTFSDGRRESVILDYPFSYANEAADPWSPRNRIIPSFPTTMQTPPPNLAKTEPPLVRYVLAHSTPQGTTLLPPCGERRP